MRNFQYAFIFLFIACQGCTATHSTLAKDSLSEKHMRRVARPQAVAKAMGKIIAKADFQGVVKASYVKLEIVDRTNPQKIYELQIGDKTHLWDLPWKTQTVNPDYFVLNLPVGSYRFQKISIPVGTTLASEPMNVSFDVKEDKINYLGTLKVVGISEKIHLGLMPLFKPGFNYHLQVRDERLEAFFALRKRFPEIRNEMDIRLMRVVMPTNLAIRMKG